MPGGGLGFLNKKPWHPSAPRNLENVWKKEQEAIAEKKKMEERMKELHKERQRDELMKMGEAAGANFYLLSLFFHPLHHLLLTIDRHIDITYPWLLIGYLSIPLKFPTQFYNLPNLTPKFDTKSDTNKSGLSVRDTSLDWMYAGGVAARQQAEERNQENKTVNISTVTVAPPPGKMSIKFKISQNWTLLFICQLVSFVFPLLCIRLSKTLFVISMHTLKQKIVMETALYF